MLGRLQSMVTSGICTPYQVFLIRLQHKLVAASGCDASVQPPIITRILILEARDKLAYRLGLPGEIIPESSYTQFQMQLLATSRNRQMRVVLGLHSMAARLKAFLHNQPQGTNSKDDGSLNLRRLQEVNSKDVPQEKIECSIFANNDSRCRHTLGVPCLYIPSSPNLLRTSTRQPPYP